MPPELNLNKNSTPHAVLNRYFGYNAFRENQEAIIRQLLTGDDAFVLMPTGSGKSICYQIPAILRPGVAVIISPLIALMQDQVEALRQNGVRAELLNSSLEREAAQGVYRKVRRGAADLLYVAPERLLMPGFQDFLQQVPLALFAIDEAHCVSQWGHDFRPEYLQITDVTRNFPGVPRVALTATADAVTRRDILQKLDLQHAAHFISSFDRPNIHYRIVLKKSGNKQLRDFIRKEHPRDAGIVYVRTRKRCDQIAAWLQEQDIPGLAYHAGLDGPTRQRRQRRFLVEEQVVMVATIAFGMGIDKPDVRFVAHLDLPASMEAYYQETGRAGRDGRPADAWMAYSLADVMAMRKVLDRSEGGEDFKRIRQRKLEALLGFCETTACRREVLLGYLGERYQAPCNHCDTCLKAVEEWDGTIAAQKALSCVYRTGQRFGAAHLTDVLVGNANQRVVRLGHDRLKTFGVGAELSVDQWRSVFRQLLAGGLLNVNMAEIAGFRLTEKSWPVLRGDTPVQLRKDPQPVKSGKTARTAGPIENETLSAVEMELFEALRHLRLDTARELGVPPYVVFHDRTLREMAQCKPCSRSDLLQITGIGELKADKHGQAFLAAIADFNVRAPAKDPGAGK